MEIALVVARLALACVFIVSGLAKAMDQEGARQGARDFGVPKVLASGVAVALPVIELALAVALLTASIAWSAAIVAMAMLAVFTAAVARNLVLGRKTDCHCFGQIGSGPIGRGTLVRNGVLLALALIVVAGGPDRAGADVWAAVRAGASSEPVATVVGGILFLALVIQTRFLTQLLAQNGRLIVRMDELERASGGRPVGAQPAPPRGLAVGATAPEFSAKGLHGETMTLGALRSGDTPVVLLFADPQCGPCNALLPDVGRWQRDHGSKVTLALVTRGTADANRTKVREHGLRNVLLQEDREIAERYLVTGTPSAVQVRADGTIGSALAEGAEAIARLVAQSVGGAVALSTGDQGNCGAPGNNMVAGAAKLGDPAPAVRLPDLSGSIRDLARVTGRTLVLFWNPGCGFCQQLLPQLVEWEHDRPPGAPGVFIVSTGSVEANRALGLRSTIVLDPDFSTGRAFGVTGTPSAVLVDEAGKIASLVAVGGPAVMSLAAPEAVNR